jgi:hypothetical protein
MPNLTTNEIAKLNLMNPTTQEIALGTSLSETQAGQIVAYTATKTADFSTAVALFTAPFAMEIVDVIVEAHAASTNGTVKIMKATDEICTAIVCAVDGVVAHMSAGATGATKARRVLAAGNVINIQATGDVAASTLGKVTVIGVRV